MPGLFPNPSAAPESFRVGDKVRWFLPGKEPSSEVGVVTQLCPGISKVWVEFPNGGNQQRDPSELLLVSPFVGQAVVKKDTGYSNFDKSVSDKTYGTIGNLREQALEMAKRLVSKSDKKSEKKVSSKMASLASKIASDFAVNVVEKLSGDILECVDKKMTDVQAYQSLYPRYGNICSDTFMRTAISKIYKIKT